MEDHGRKAGVQGLRVGLQILIPEELGVGETRGDHALVAGAHDLRFAAGDIADGDERGQEAAVGRMDGEVTLVILHHRHQRFRRHAQETLGEASGQRHRPFHQRRDLGQQFVVEIGLAVNTRRRRANLLADQLTALVEVGDHVAGIAQRGRVILGRGQGNGVGMVETVAECRRACAHTEDLGVEVLMAEQQHRPVHRTRKGDAGNAPGHALARRQLERRLGGRGRQQLVGRRATAGLLKEEILALAGIALLQIGNGNAMARGETGGGLRRLAAGIEGGTHRRPAMLDRALGLALGHALDDHRQAARGGVAARRAVGEPESIERGRPVAHQRLAQCLEFAGGQFLGSDFQQQIAHVAHAAASPSLHRGKPSASRVA